MDEGSAEDDICGACPCAFRCEKLEVQLRNAEAEIKKLHDEIMPEMEALRARVDAWVASVSAAPVLALCLSCDMVCNTFVWAMNCP